MKNHQNQRKTIPNLGHRPFKALEIVLHTQLGINHMLSVDPLWGHGCEVTSCLLEMLFSRITPFSRCIAPGAPDFLRSPISVPRFYFYAACAPGYGGVECGSGWGGAEGWDGAGGWCACVYVCVRCLALLLACLLASFCVAPLTSPRREGPEIITQAHVEIHVRQPDYIIYKSITREGLEIITQSHVEIHV